ncbi:unnamed protein product [Aureobasidium vineae]|uniref:Uncharacterized protein n=1 Tax=Aureobasidium vineae TaxID=2773715 RepID=A0A9N8JIQ5_9PEZI|nr:unnamed protein product [Aureobasidium vineae]
MPASAQSLQAIFVLKLTLYTSSFTMFTVSVLSALVLASCQQALAQSCSGFKVTTNYSDLTYTSLSSRSYIISEGTISKVVNLRFKETWTYPVATNRGAWSIANGTNAYVAFTPNTICATGRLSGCQGNDLEGQTVTACTLEGVKYGDGLAGVIHEVVTDRESAANLTCNPSNTTQAMNGNYTGSCTGTEDEKGAASALGGVSLALLSVSLL